MIEPTIEQVAKARLMYLQYESRGEGVYLVAKLLAERDHARGEIEGLRSVRDAAQAPSVLLGTVGKSQGLSEAPDLRQSQRLPL